VGKKTVIICVAMIVLAIALATVWGQQYPILFIVICVLAVFVYGLNSIDTTLDKQPHLALMDGAEIVRIREIEASAKGMTINPDQQAIPKPFIETFPVQIEGPLT